MFVTGAVSLRECVDTDLEFVREFKNDVIELALVRLRRVSVKTASTLKLSILSSIYFSVCGSLTLRPLLFTEFKIVSIFSTFLHIFDEIVKQIVFSGGNRFL